MGKPIETVYEHLAGEKYFLVSAEERWSINMIRRLKEKYPDEVEIRNVNKDGSLTARLPIDWMRVVPKKKYSDEQLAAMGERMKSIRENS